MILDSVFVFLSVSTYPLFLSEPIQPIHPILSCPFSSHINLELSRNFWYDLLGIHQINPIKIYKPLLLYGYQIS